MKKILTLLTGIAFLIAIVAADSGGSAGTQTAPSNSNKVKIYLKAIEIDGEWHLEMYDSNDPDNVVVDNLETIVQPGIKVIWKLNSSSGIKKINKIVSNGNLFRNGAKKNILSKEFTLDIPENAVSGPKQKYDIEFVDKENNQTWTIDPYLELP